MTLTFSGAPLSSAPGGSTNFSLDDAPKHRLLFEDHPRRIRALVDGHSILDSTARQAAARVEHPAALLPAARRHRRALPRAAPTTPPTARSRATPPTSTSKVGERRIENAVWHYPEPLERGRVAARLRVGLHRGGRPVAAGGRAGARRASCATPTTAWTCWRARARPRSRWPASGSPTRTGRSCCSRPALPAVVYLLRADVLPGRARAQRHHLRVPLQGPRQLLQRARRRRAVADAAWTYETPLPEALKVAGTCPSPARRRGHARLRLGAARPGGCRLLVRR